MLAKLYSLMSSGRTQGLSGAVHSTIMVSIKYEQQQTAYELDRSCTVAELRNKLARDFIIPLSEVKVILGGRVLTDDMSIEDIGVGMESILFAIRHRGSGRSEDQVEEPAAPREVVEERQTLHRVPALPAVAENALLKDQYFVYCKLCREVKPGRLRVKCSICGDGAILVQEDPRRWEDVLMAGQLSATCQSLQCHDCVPVFYFKCAEQHFGNPDHTAVVLRHIRPNRRCIPCITCADVLSCVVVFPCAAAHVMCLQCFKTYCSIRLRERQFVHNVQFGYTLPCPERCPDSFIQEQHHFCVLEPAEYERYKDFGVEECVRADGGIYCPQPSCGQVFLMETEGTRAVCPYCKFVFCRHCEEQAHEGDCANNLSASQSFQFSDPQRAERARWERQSAHDRNHN
ncbi:hypothetical protein C0Q70_10956 [Pomacea canaliculata]|uniref:E3 ubiquitin-protein ligase parkin n=1 Tax=Pomacea canaliculata TaxID=400727 RepID=A0A2T7P4M7_POMCA|nr:E3 ubiquitin-protein ligase parkin-like [Pomacea canaliculata]XP_025097424.1 E3 ubiquitin-protein ligase parkin-like [Pomacea canaliculata]PVD28369.1 hypothetical protein C0Q70_10956 [Pomacea canaliculata]